MSTLHSAQFIAEMKQKLEEERDMLRGELTQVGHKEGKSEFQADFPDYGRNEEDNAAEVADFDALRATADTTQQRLHDVEAALERLEQGGYGVTADGALIPEERLRANPAATTVIKPQEGKED